MWNVASSPMSSTSRAGIPISSTSCIRHYSFGCIGVPCLLNNDPHLLIRIGRCHFSQQGLQETVCGIQ